MPTPAEQLVGLGLDGGWTVFEHVVRPASATGGYFSQGYRVRNADGHIAYLKALDFSRAMSGSNPAALLLKMTSAFEYERTVCQHCVDKRLTRVVRALSHGVIRTNPADPMTTVQYLIFEMADGDIRKHLDLLADFDFPWILRSCNKMK
jgi:hypothetical protein